MPKRVSKKDTSNDMVDFVDECCEAMLCAISCSTFATLNLTLYRNGEKRMDCLEITKRRALGELGYAVLSVASLVEAVVRAILFIPTLIATLICDPKGNYVWVSLMGEGAIMCSANVLFCLVALVRNIFSRTIEDNPLDYACCFSKR